ncbi:hypothetical protein ALICE_49 [Mycobacterium phage Alice]|uniref:Uncharacterized protein n=1 Tax=Mycobacterium phage Alice TaxID=1034128 RepID=G1BKF1_9CAUD|nr:hypothetical protein ALICE_49 [Mycobacterium phage Alice]AEJ94311.1 hypothetical protein ALICE_49 [Mycobacterium phage Alice]AXN53886.1 hypothetical protein SEA_RABINOVISH_54 [Mycobacterium phage Rabinovish]
MKYLTKHDSDVPRSDIVVYEVPDAQPDLYNDNRWPVDVYSSQFDVLFDGDRAGEVFIRVTDGRISSSSIPNPLDDSGTVRRYALALLAAADRWDELFPDGKVDREVLDRMARELRERFVPDETA